MPMGSSQTRRKPRSGSESFFCGCLYFFAILREKHVGFVLSLASTNWRRERSLRNGFGNRFQVAFNWK